MDSSDRLDGAPAPGSLAGIGASVVALISTRFELLGLELREEALRVQRTLFMVAAAVLFLGAALVLLALVVAQAFGDTHPLAALVAMTMLYAGIAAWLFLRARNAAARGPAPFAATLRELERDLAAMKDRDA